MEMENLLISLGFFSVDVVVVVFMHFKDERFFTSFFLFSSSSRRRRWSYTFWLCANCSLYASIRDSLRRFILLLSSNRFSIPRPSFAHTHLAFFTDERGKILHIQIFHNAEKKQLYSQENTHFSWSPRRNIGFSLLNSKLRLWFHNSIFIERFFKNKKQCEEIEENCFAAQAKSETTWRLIIWPKKKFATIATGVFQVRAKSKTVSLSFVHLCGLH